MQRPSFSNTIGLPVRLGRFLARTLDPRRRETLEHSLRIRSSRWEERQVRLADRAQDHQQKVETPAPTPPPVEQEASTKPSLIRRIGRFVREVLELVDFVGVLFHVLTAIVRGVLRVLGGVLEGLSIFDI